MAASATTSTMTTAHAAPHDELPVHQKRKHNKARTAPSNKSTYYSKVQEHNINKAKYHFAVAKAYAKEGNRAMMECYIQKAHVNLQEGNVDYTENYLIKPAARIRSSLNPVAERKYHASQVKVNLKIAKGYSIEGNDFMKDWYKEKAYEHRKAAKQLARYENLACVRWAKYGTTY